ncbi:chromosome partitioning protein [Paraburkholderia sp. BL27I4N3]|uniref:ParA family protein n=1 Tax=Paraburkholderia sp. BL27I4N3 TaxID=1938805 RepID=UPI000E289FF7|nr:AAA family ATPase [Paraburkholderia sp. BL27I4N3]REE06581.1 chromosome partitioning protein [Paraburkholderia sp. BL27I4N3]
MAVAKPIVTIAQSVRHVPLRVELDDIGGIAQNASEMLLNVRDSMLAPHPRKHAPVFTTSQIASLCRIDRKKVNYYWEKTDLGLPQGTVLPRTREFTLVEAREWVKKVGPFPKRPTGVKGKKIAIGNFKGGVSKTTTAMTLAQGLSLFGRRVLLVDLDPQASLSALNGILADSEVGEEQTILPLIYGEQSSLEYAVQPSYWDGIDLIPASAALFGAEFYLPFKQSKDRTFKFWDVLNRGLEPLLDTYDAVIIDTPPALSYVTINAFMAADGLIVPTPPSALDYASSTQFWSLFTDLARSMKAIVPDLNKHFDFIHVLLAKVDSSQAATYAVREWINRTYERLVLPIEIPTTTVTSSASTEFGTVYDISKYDGSTKTYQRAREAYDRLAEMIDQEIFALWGAEQEGK